MKSTLNSRKIFTGRRLLMLSLLVAMSLFARSENLNKIIDLEGTWKFTVGDDPAWAMTNYNDADWDIVSVPGNWEQNGFRDYNGFAWYRKEFRLSRSLDELRPFLVLGFIDDVDEVYLNGHLIGASGVMPPQVTTAFRLQRKYPLPTELLNPNGKNVIAVRVFDEYLDGGIYAGPVGIFYDEDNELLTVNLAGYWNFKTLLEEEHSADRFHNQTGGKIYVPGYWESFGYPDFDGTGIYSTTFKLPSSFDDSDLMLVLGYVDDIDKAYLNGERIGTVETLDNSRNRDVPTANLFRGYKIRPGLLVKGGENVLEVKVYDTGGLGGIYEGPVGIATSENYQKLNKQQQEKPYSIWEELFKGLFEWE